jgi:uncharacterized protein (DUF1697 family)
MKNTMCAFLRGINVNGKNMKMADICDVFRQESVDNVRSVLATGNILFDSSLLKSELRRKLESAISRHYQSNESLFIKDQKEIDAILKGVPFTHESDLHIYVFICENGFESTLMERFQSIIPATNEEALIYENQFYWQVNKGETLDSGFSKILADKKLRNQFTSRNINTIQKISEKMRAAFFS